MELGGITMNKRQKKKFRKKFGYKKWSNVDVVINITLKFPPLPRWVHGMDNYSKYQKDLWHWWSGIDRGGNSNEQASEEEIRKEEQVQDILWISTSGDISKNIQTYRPKE